MQKYINKFFAYKYVKKFCEHHSLEIWCIQSNVTDFICLFLLFLIRELIRIWSLSVNTTKKNIFVQICGHDSQPLLYVWCFNINYHRAEVFAGNTDTPVRVLEGMIPIFTVEGLAPGGDYVVRVTALNRKGSSIPVSLEAYTLKVAENRMSEYPKVSVWMKKKKYQVNGEFLQWV